MPPAQSPATCDVSKAARQGGVWSIAAYAFSKVSGFASSIVLARVLLPEHYGLIGMVNTVLAVVQVMGFWGIGAAVTYERENWEECANTGWWLDVIVGVALFAISNSLAPLAALYYREPRVQLVILVASLNYLINPIGNMMETLMRRSFQFRLSTVIGLVGGFVTCVLTVVLALAGAGVWSFVYPSLVAGVLTVVLRWRACSFRPRLKVDWSFSRRILGFGKHMFGAGLFDYINQNVDYVLVGGLMGGRQLGLYVFAYNLGTWIVQNISGVISGILFPTVASVQHDHEKASSLFLRLVQVISIAGFPLVALMWAVAPLFLGSVYGGKWLPCVTAFRLIAVYGMGRAVCNPALGLISAMGRPDINLKVSAATSPVLVTAVYLGSRYGIDGVALATAIAHGLFVWLYVVIPFRILRWDVSRFFKALAPAFVSSVIAAAITGAAYEALGAPTVSVGLLLTLGVLCAGLYAAAMLLLFRGTALSTLNLVRTSLREARE